MKLLSVEFIPSETNLSNLNLKSYFHYSYIEDVVTLFLIHLLFCFKGQAYSRDPFQCSYSLHSQNRSTQALAEIDKGDIEHRMQTHFIFKYRILVLEREFLHSEFIF